MPEPKSRNWCGTLNNYEQCDLVWFEMNFISYLPKLKYAIYGVERGELGTPHLQLFVRFESQVRIASLRAIFNRAHWECCHGSSEQNRDYCMKEGYFKEYGVFGTRGEGAVRGGQVTKDNWEQYRELAKAGDLDSIDAKAYIAYYKTFKEIARDYMVQPPDLGDVSGVWYYGESGTGKSRAARAEFPGYYLKPCNKWWDGYQNEDNVIIDDFGKQHEMLGYHLKIWADRYCFPAEVKNSTICIRPKVIIITSNYHPKDIWSDDNTLSPILRRFKIVRFRCMVAALLDPVEEERLV